MGLKWRDVQRIGEQLYDLHETTHPLSVRFTDLHRWVTALPDFEDDPEQSTEGKLEAIQMVWYEEWQEDHDPAEDPYAHLSGDRSKK